jgi:putative Holliday junction resolvase
MALDIGEKKIGVAVSDPSMTLASPRGMIIRRSDQSAIEEIGKLAQENNVVRLIIGLPYSLDGGLGPQALRVLEFKDRISEKLKLDIALQDERLSSVTANQKLREAGKKRQKLKNEIDAAAATIILQSYLDENSFHRDTVQQL